MFKFKKHDSTNVSGEHTSNRAARRSARLPLRWHTRRGHQRHLELKGSWSYLSIISDVSFINPLIWFCSTFRLIKFGQRKDWQKCFTTSDDVMCGNIYINRLYSDTLQQMNSSIKNWGWLQLPPYWTIICTSEPI